mmetsp:Transcript_25630/g.81384  ORF Transcript_25630/g.81384 Transcript_25630/m.81384 type:complete len:336 (+) Transcript_25630:54-1061(+)
MPFTPYPVYNLLMSDQHAAQDLLELSIPEAGDLDVLGGLGAHVGVGGLDGLEHASDLTGLGIVAGHVEDGGALELDDLLVVLTRELLSISGSGEGHSVVVAGGGATALGVEEGGATVRGDGEVTAELGGVALADELLDGEEEGDALAARELHGGGGVVDAILLSELHGAVAADVELAGHAVEGVGEAGHELGLDELRVATLELGVLLDGEGGGLHAEEVEVVAAGLDLDVGGAGLNHGAGVGNAGALHLEVGEALQLVVGERLGAASDKGGSGEGSGGLASGLLDLGDHLLHVAGGRGSLHGHGAGAGGLGGGGLEGHPLGGASGKGRGHHDGGG